ncbi:MAG: 50S ribosomal protein L17 [Bacteroidota bacterium]
MRHGKKFNHLKRKSAHRKALMRNMASALIEHKRIKTTLAKAKALRQYVEPLITKAKTDSVHSRRVVASYLQNKESVQELFGDIAEKVANRPGGYTRVIKLGFRRSDGAEMALIELVDYNETYASPKAGESTSSKRRRRRRGGGSSNAETATAVAEETVEEVEEQVAEDEEVETTDTDATEEKEEQA